MSTVSKPSHFIQDVVDTDKASNKWHGRVHTRFPPEPNGYLHVGHAKSIILNYSLAQANGGRFNLRFDDTNPAKEDQEYVDSIVDDVRWLTGLDSIETEAAHTAEEAQTILDYERTQAALDRPAPSTSTEGVIFFASDYFPLMYRWAEQLIEKGKAYVDDQSPDEMSKNKGDFNKPGVNSPFRDRTAAENLELFRKMKAGEFAPGAKTLRAKIDMGSGNMNLRDPVMYRIVKAAHHRTGEKWCIYPSYDWAHGLEDSIERVTHSICTLEFKDHRPLYDWFLEQLGIYHPQQIEFARLNLTYTVMSKRLLLALVKDKHVNGWDDPRMPTIAGMRRRGYSREALWKFAEEIGVTNVDSKIDVGRLENAVREDLNKRAPRRMAVLKPLKVTLTDWPEGKIDELDAVNNPEDESAGTRKVPFGRELYVERDDFMEDPPKKFFRLAPGREVRLRYGYLITCREVVKNAAGEVIELKCTHDPASRGGNAPDGRKVKATLHWASASHSVKAEVRLYDRLFNVENPNADEYLKQLNPGSLEKVEAFVEPELAKAKAGETCQFERLGYFSCDPDSKAGAPVFNRVVGLRDAWAKEASKE
ncbi:MAG: glutamine--tRNA ligase/YqeY domain fusion protein [Myxococcaceae bacterium]